MSSINGANNIRAVLIIDQRGEHTMTEDINVRPFGSEKRCGRNGSPSTIPSTPVLSTTTASMPDVQTVPDDDPSRDSSGAAAARAEALERAKARERAEIRERADARECR